jgi:uncharacterized membrane protein YidH (DUF202 family)
VTGTPDRGAQPERTALAWRRTALSAAGGSLIAARLSAPSLGVVAVAVGVLGAVLAAAVWWSADRRYPPARRSLDEGRPLGTGTGIPLAALAAAAVVVGGLALGFVLTRT